MGSFAPKGHARVDPQRPAAFAICDRCGFMYNHRDLNWDTQYMGRFIKRTGFLVCESCNDRPNPTLRPIVLPPDPVPILNPRSEPMHCHTFKPLADNIQPPHRPNPAADTIDTMFPPVDMWHDVTADKGSVCDTRTYKDGWSVPVPIPPFFPPEPPIKPPDAVTDNTEATADTTSTTADAGPLYAYDNTTDTTLITADTMHPTTDAFPLAKPPPYAGTSWEEADTTLWTADMSPKAWIYKDGNTADTIKKKSDSQMAPQVNVNAYPDYLYAADVHVKKADITTVRSDNLT